jgi:hypothetical protein
MNDENQDVLLESSPEEEATVSEDAQTLAEPTPSKVVEKTVPYSRFKEIVDENKRLKTEPKTAKSLEVEDFIDISASLEGLDQREKSYLAQQHKLTGQPLTEIRNNEDFQLWQSAYRSKTERENTLKPSSTQPEEQRAKKLSEILTDPNTPREEKERLMRETGLYKDPGSTPPGFSRKVLVN